jgi:hypothetical protein
MATRRAKVHASLGYFASHGFVDFASELGTDFVQVELNPDTQPPPGVPLRHVKVVGSPGTFTEMTAVEKTAVDASPALAARLASKTSNVLRRVVPNLAALPNPPPAPGLLVGVRDAGGAPAIAISGPSNWAIFRASGTFP